MYNIIEILFPAVFMAIFIIMIFAFANGIAVWQWKMAGKELI